MHIPHLRTWLASGIVLSLAAGCEGGPPTEEEQSQLDELELSAAGIPASPTNLYADDAGATKLGQKLFFDKRLSLDETVACADCHHADQGFADEKRLSEGINKQKGGRHALPITSASLQAFLLWDGRADSVWRQPLFALENSREMDFTRTDVALFIESSMREEYEAVFGPLPDLSEAPPHVRPGEPGWEELSPATKDSVQRVFVNVGKAIEAYERKLTCVDTRFDRWVRGEADLSDRELEGAAQFVRSNCIECHSGPAFSDGKFHNLGIVRDDDAEIDRGRDTGLGVLLGDELNGASVYSDDPVFGAKKLASAKTETRRVGAFRTASLRGVTQRPRFGHVGAHTSLEEFIDDTYRGRGRGGRGGDGDGRGDDDDGDIVGSVDPILDRVNVDGGEADAIVEFLRTTECPAVPEELLVP